METASSLSDNSKRRLSPGDLIIHPIAPFSLFVLTLNDRFRKEHYGNVITGTLSDIAGLVFFPLLLISLIEMARKALRRKRAL